MKPHGYQSLCREWLSSSGDKTRLERPLAIVAPTRRVGSLQQFATVGLDAVAINCGSRPIIWPVAARTPAEARRLRRRRSPPYVWPRGPAPLSATASAGTH